MPKIEEATLVKHPLGSYAINGVRDDGEKVPEEREPFFQVDYDVVGLAEHIGYIGKTGSEEFPLLCDWTELAEEERSAHFAGAYDFLDNKAGDALDTNTVDAYFEEEDRGWR